MCKVHVAFSVGVVINGAENGFLVVCLAHSCRIGISAFQIEQIEIASMGIQIGICRIGSAFHAFEQLKRTAADNLVGKGS